MHGRYAYYTYKKFSRLTSVLTERISNLCGGFAVTVAEVLLGHSHLFQPSAPMYLSFPFMPAPEPCGVGR